MFKLLTEEEKKKILHEYAARRMVIILYALILILLIGLIGLLPSYLLSNSRQEEVIERTRIIDTLQFNKEEITLQNWLNGFNYKLQTLSPKLDSDRPSKMIEKVVEQKIDGISITGFSWLRAKDKLTLSINGVARDRETLLEFKDQMTNSPSFSGVTLPPNNLAEDKEIDFQISFSLTP